jgi:[1-hydroxy-2-(trimethylamino)ethyl]phosphonate dioxygenase
MSTADDIVALYARRGTQAYFGEDVSMSEHGLQAAHFAQVSRAPDALILAALLHDIGHLTESVPDDIADWTRDARHEHSGSRWLARYFGPEISEPVRLHVPAKRYLCATEPAYFQQLSAASVTTLKLQGGPMSAAEIVAFEAEPYWREAVQIRKWDDQGKVAGLETPGFEHYRALIDRFARAPAAVRLPAALPAVRALLFDLDGTLINTEMHTDTTVGAVMARYGFPDFSLPHTETHGRTWTHVAGKIRSMTNIAVPVPELAAAMLTYWNGAVSEVQAIPGAPQAMRAAVAAGLQLAVVSSSPRSVIDHFLTRLGVSDCVGENARVGGDSVRVGKPNPEGFLLAARVLNVEPAEALVFEDSEAGLLAARAAGMRSMFVTCVAADIAENSARATATFTNYETLPAGFWHDLAAGTLELANRSFP